jgi:hypothetical protein
MLGASHVPRSSCAVKDQMLTLPAGIERLDETA